MTESSSVTGKVFSDLFMKPIQMAFRAPNADTSAAALLELYFDNLKTFSPVTLSAACKAICRTRKDPFIPTIAECLAECRRQEELAKGWYRT